MAAPAFTAKRSLTFSVVNPLERPTAKAKAIVTRAAHRLSTELEADIREAIAERAEPSRWRYTGRLARSWVKLVPDVRPDLSFDVRAGSWSPYAEIHDIGGTVHAGAKRLTVPLTPEAETRTAPSFGRELFKTRSRLGDTLLVRRTGLGRVEPLYQLRQWVKVPAARYVDYAVAAYLDRVGPLAAGLFAGVAGTALRVSRTRRA